MNLNAALVQVTESVRPQIEVADILRTHGPDYRKNHRLSTGQRKAMGHIESCRTSALGGHVDVCDNGCGYTRISYNSCRDRHCPKCQGSKQQEWVNNQLSKLIVLGYDVFACVINKTLSG